MRSAGFETLREEDPGNAQVATLLGDCYLQMNDPPRALVRSVSELAGAHTDNLDFAFVLGSAMIGTGTDSVRESLWWNALLRSAKQRRCLSAGGKDLVQEDWRDGTGAQRPRGGSAPQPPNLTGIYTLRGCCSGGDLRRQGRRSRPSKSPRS